jgi:propanol-preferring alcohol dehydrogenase
MMRAARLHSQAPIGDAPLRLEDCPDPEPGEGEVRIAVSACGACHTDLHIIEGDLPAHRLPLIPGHQIVGTIESVGPGVDSGRVGERVGVPWMSSACGACVQCVAGRENLCDAARFTGYDVDGGFAELVVAPQRAAHRLPNEIGDLEAAPLLCAGIIGYRSLRLSGIEPGQRLGLFGFGASAHLAIQVARHWGCEVFVFTRSEHHRELARRLGAAWTGSAEDSPPEKLHAAVTFAPVGRVAREALRCTAPGGTVAINAIHLDRVPELDYREHLYGERVLRSVTNLTHRDAEEFLALAAEISLRVTVERFGLHEANRALARMKNSELEAAAVLVPSGAGRER